jgi:macrodomain Ter protein organizer (MatP/YcbG family)
MGRPKHIYTHQEIRWIQQYIEKKMKLETLWPSESSTFNFQAISDFAKLDIDKNTDYEPLEKWCAKYLDEKQKKRLEDAIRARRRRHLAQLKGTKLKKTITLDREAWLYLSALAKNDKVTISQFLINRLEDEYLALPEE